MDRRDVRNRGVRESLLGHGIVSAGTDVALSEYEFITWLRWRARRIYRVPPVSTRQCRHPEDGEDCKCLSVTRDRKERMLAYQPFDSNLESLTRSKAASGSCRFEIEVNHDALTIRCVMKDCTFGVIKGRPGRD